MYSAMRMRPKIRLYVPVPLQAGHHLQLDEKQSHYLAQVMRMSEGNSIAVFNGRDGEWLANIAAIQKKSVRLSLQSQLQPQQESPDLWLIFAPIKNKTDSVIEKAVELGASTIGLVYTRYAVVKSINREKLEAHAIEAAEQCGRLDVPPIEEYKDLGALLADWPKGRTLLWGDESGGGKPLADVLASLRKGNFALLVGPEGGFHPDEQRLLKSLPFVKPFGMGPRILRADTAAVAALACMQAWLGDWDEAPSFTAAG